MSKSNLDVNDLASKWRAQFSEDQVRAMGIAPDQVAERNARTAKILEAKKPKPGTEGFALLRHLTR